MKRSAIFLSLALTGCFGTKQPVQVKAPVQPAQLPPPVAAAPARTPDEPTTPAPAATPPKVAQPNLTSPQLPPPVAPPRRRSTPTPPPAVTPTAPAPVSVPQLGEILTDAQRRQVQTETADRLADARDVLTRASKSKGKLTTAQAETRERIRTFIQQAEETRKRDPKTALELAKRADLLARDLLPTLH